MKTKRNIFILLLLCLLFISCDGSIFFQGSENEGSNTVLNQFKPPEWIIGTWNPSDPFNYSYTFTEDSIIEDGDNWDEFLENNNVTSNCDTSTYKLTFEEKTIKNTTPRSGIGGMTFLFTKIDSNTINLSMSDQINNLSTFNLTLE